MSTGPLIVAILAAVAILIIFTGLWRSSQVRDPVDARLAQFGAASELVGSGAPEATGKGRRGRRAPGGGKLSGRFADMLTKADLPLTAAEFLLIVVGAAAAGFGIGFWRGGVLFGALLSLIALVVPFVYLNMRGGQRRQQFTNQLPDVLTLIIGALRAGYSVNQSIEMLIDRLPKPASTEFGRAMRAVSLGLPITKALNDMADRVASDDLYMVVSAMSVQQEVGGNLVQILETISHTIRERIRIKREISVMTAQQRTTGIVLSCLPIAAVLMIGAINREYISGLFTTFIGRIMVGIALFLQVVGYMVVRKIVDIEV